MIEHKSVKLTVNGVVFERSVEPRLLLSDFLRQELGLTGTHVGCEHGICGACTIIVNGDSVRSCLMLAVQADAAVVETVEGLGTMQKLNAVQKAFQDQHALQCGFCTPGMLMTITDLIRKYPARHRRRDPRGLVRQPVPLHRLRAHRQGGAHPRPTDGRRSMKMHVLSGGRLRMKKSIYLPDADRSETIELPVSSILLAAQAGQRAVRYRLPSLRALTTRKRAGAAWREP